jgi:hypothetical protein
LAPLLLLLPLLLLAPGSPHAAASQLVSSWLCCADLAKNTACYANKTASDKAIGACTVVAGPAVPFTGKTCKALHSNVMAQIEAVHLIAQGVASNELLFNLPHHHLGEHTCMVEAT